ncbi:MAG: hypothetical protein ABH870_05105 [bacterium]
MTFHEEGGIIYSRLFCLLNFEGGYGTLSEIAFALKAGIRVIGAC